MAVQLIQLIWLKGQGESGPGGFVAMPDGYSNTKALGAVLYTEHVYAFEIAAVILLLLMKHHFDHLDIYRILDWLREVAPGIFGRGG